MRELEKEIQILKDLLKKVESLDSENKDVKANITYLKDKITELELEKIELGKHITFKDKVKSFFKSKTIIINSILIVLEILNLFTDIFTSSQSTILNSLGVIIPTLTIYFRVKATTQSY